MFDEKFKRGPIQQRSRGGLRAEVVADARVGAGLALRSRKAMMMQMKGQTVR